MLTQNKHCKLAIQMVQTVKSLYFTLYLCDKTNNKIDYWLK